MTKMPGLQNKKRSYLRKLRCCGVAVITSASHAEGLQFDPGQHQKVDNYKMMNKDCAKILFVENYISRTPEKLPNK